MVFSSITFLFYFFPVFFLAYYLADKRFKNAIILFGSIFFYAWGAPKFIFVLLGTTIADFLLVRQMDKSGSRSLRTVLLLVSLGMNLGLLAYFKYSNFFIDNLNHVLASAGMQPIAWAKLALPIGISFYTFETITYVVDVYRRVHPPLKKFWDYQLYIILFPKLIAGPIIRYHEFAGQIYDHTSHETPDNRLRGIYRFFLGLGKKVLIANTLGAAATTIFNIQHPELDTATAWMGALSYTMQIYFDFSGYSDMAIGLALMMGFRIPENFNNPYTALSITDFWRRWHISLGAWMRQYLYIPLGGNKAPQWRVYLNLWLVFLASGLWHGAAWGFVAWGAYHGCFLVAERLFLSRWLQRLGKFSAMYTFLVVMVGWVFFKIEYFHYSLGYLQRMFTWHGGTSSWLPTTEYYTFLALALFFSFFTLSNAADRLHQRLFYQPYSVRLHLVVAAVTLFICLLSAGRITTSTFNPFIYFRF